MNLTLVSLRDDDDDDDEMWREELRIMDEMEHILPLNATTAALQNDEAQTICSLSLGEGKSEGIQGCQSQFN